MADQSLFGAVVQTAATIWSEWKARRVLCPTCHMRPGLRCDVSGSDPPLTVHQARVRVALGEQCSVCGYQKHENTHLIPANRCPSCGAPMVPL